MVRLYDPALVSRLSPAEAAPGWPRSLKSALLNPPASVVEGRLALTLLTKHFERHVSAQVKHFVEVSY
jgi:hypothetical protein